MIKNLKWNVVMFILLLLTIITICFYTELKFMETLSSSVVNEHGTFYSKQVSNSIDIYPSTYWSLYMAFDREKMEYTLHSGGFKNKEIGSYKISKAQKNVLYLTRHSDEKIFYIEIDPIDNSFIYVIDSEIDDVRRFVKIHDHLTYVHED